MRILLLSFYFQPDIGPGPLRAASIVDALVEVTDGKVDIDVVTTMPNRYNSLSVTALAAERQDVVSIHRIRLPIHKSGMTDQARAFAVYAQSVVEMTRRGRWDVVIATSSRLMTAALGAYVAKRTGAKLYLDIRDLFTDTMGDLLAGRSLRVVMPFVQLLEGWTFRSADKINVVSAGFIPHIARITNFSNTTTFTNGIDEEFVSRDFSRCVPRQSPLIVYAGNIGDGQGLHHLVPRISGVGKRVRFRIIGDGSRREELSDLLRRKEIRNVEIIDPVPRQDLFAHYCEADALFLHLNDHAAFRRVLPSKIFEYAATGKPILAGVAGYAADFLKEEVPGVEVFSPCDVNAMETSLQKILDGPRTIVRREFCDRYLRKKIMRGLANDVVALCPTTVQLPQATSV